MQTRSGILSIYVKYAKEFFHKNSFAILQFILNIRM